MQHLKLRQVQVQKKNVALSVILFLGGIFSFPFCANAQQNLTAQVVGPSSTLEIKGGEKEGKAAQGKLLPVLSVEKIKYGTVVSIQGGSLPGLIMDVWCYEDNLGNPVSSEKDGNAVVLIHKRGTVTVTSRFEPVSDGVDINVTVSGPNPDDVRRIRGINPCCELERSPTFQNKGDYVNDFVSRCFVYLENGRTFLKDTKRIPGTMPNKDDENANIAKPWIQEYYPAWRKHPGQVKGERGYSTDRPVYPIIGAISRDKKYLAAVAWPDAGRLGQVWHDCIHPRPVIEFDATTGEIKTRGKIYLMENDGKKLIAMFKKDFPEWKRPPDEK